MLQLLAAGCGAASSSGVTTAAIRFDPCQPLALALDDSATADEGNGAQAAAALWNQAAGAQLTVARAVTPSGDSGVSPATLPVQFMAAAAPSHGFFDPTRGAVLINADLTARSLTVTIAHEVGHAFGLVHVSGRPSVMNAGNLDVEPNAGDVTALAALWGQCDGAPAP